MQNRRKVFKNKLQWGYENWPFKNQNHLKTGYFGGWFWNGSDFKWSDFKWLGPFEIRTSLDHLKSGHGQPFKILTCLVFGFPLYSVKSYLFLKKFPDNFIFLDFRWFSTETANAKLLWHRTFFDFTWGWVLRCPWRPCHCRSGRVRTPWPLTRSERFRRTSENDGEHDGTWTWKKEISSNLILGIWNPDASRLWMFNWRLVCKWSGLRMASEIQKPNHLKIDQKWPLFWVSSVWLCLICLLHLHLLLYFILKQQFIWDILDLWKKFKFQTGVRPLSNTKQWTNLGTLVSPFNTPPIRYIYEPKEIYSIAWKGHKIKQKLSIWDFSYLGLKSGSSKTLGAT